MNDLAFLPLADVAARIRERSLSSSDYVRACLERIERLDPKLNAFLSVDADAALCAAQDADEAIRDGARSGPLHGIPIALKDLIDVAGTVTTAHSAILKNNVKNEDAFVVTALRNAGALLAGKTALHEFATGGPSFDLPWPPARNPWNVACHPGGSSSGSAVAVAAGLVPGAIGTDTAGSVRHPATACGVVGLKPTYGAVSRRGIFPLSFSLDHVGPLARTVEDCALLYRALAVWDRDDPSCIPHPKTATGDLKSGVRGLRLGVIEEFGRDASAEIQAAFQAALKVYESLGATLVPLELPPLAEFTGCGRLILQAESFAVHENWLRDDVTAYASRTRTRLLPGAFIDAATYIRAQQKRTQLAAAFTAAMSGLDAALCVSSLELPCVIDDPAEIARSYDRQARTPFNITGHPALSVPIGVSATSLPMGLQVVGHAFDEERILRVAWAYEQTAAWDRSDAFKAMRANLDFLNN